ncbi:MAG: hypothetical protein M3325_13570, partial [Actinomycetota bacterium]|nr:hypothetical protein [Actinomycetota bacterium]
SIGHYRQRRVNARGGGVGKQVHRRQVGEFGDDDAGKFLQFRGGVQAAVQRGAGPRQQLLTPRVLFQLEAAQDLVGDLHRAHEYSAVVNVFFGAPAIAE